MDNYVKIYLTDKKIILSQLNLKSILQILPSGKFIRIHKSYIISRDKIVHFNQAFTFSFYNPRHTSDSDVASMLWSPLATHPT